MLSTRKYVTVVAASLTLADTHYHAQYLEEPMRTSNRTAIVSNAWYSLSQACADFPRPACVTQLNPLCTAGFHSSSSLSSSVCRLASLRSRWDANLAMSQGSARISSSTAASMRATFLSP